MSLLSGGTESTPTTTTTSTTTTLAETHNWVSPPNSVGDNQAYILHDLGDGYQVENFYGDNYFYEYYTQVKDHKTGTVLIDDSRWNVEVWDAGKDRWGVLDLHSKSLYYDDSDSKQLFIERTSTDGTYTLTETYRFSKGTPKFDINFSASDFRTYRLVWESSGIAGTKAKERQISAVTNTDKELKSDFTVTKSEKELARLDFTNEKTDRFLISLGWADANEDFQKADWSAGSKKLDVYFGNFTGSFYIDPTWTTPSSVSSFSSEAALCTFLGGCADASIDDDLAEEWNENSGDNTAGWYITYDMGETQCIHAIQIKHVLFGSYNNGPPCAVSEIKVCDDSACSGESNLIASDCSFTSTLDWEDCILDDDTEGRYIYVLGKIMEGAPSATCQLSAGPTMKSIYEFDADIGGSCGATTTTTTTLPSGDAVEVLLTKYLNKR